MAGGRRQQSPHRQSSLTRVTQQKETVVGSIERIRRCLSTTSSSPIELECRLDMLNSYIGQAMVFQSELDILDPSNNERAQLEDLCIATKSLLLAKLTNNRRSSFANSTMSPPTHSSRLPSMRLPKFSGKYSEYKNFIGLFENLVDNDPTLVNIEKFNHLISCLSDEALGTVKAYQVTNENYPKALASLKRVYDNPCLIFFENISKLFDLPEMPTPSATALRSMIDTVSAIYDSLLSLGDDKSITNAIIIHLVMAKVDPTTRSKWEEQLNYEHLPLWSECEAALNKRFQHISAEESSTSRAKSAHAHKPDSSKRNKAKSFSCQTGPEQNSTKCIFCRSTEHYVSVCPSFSAIPVQQRFAFVKGVPACINCLKKGHTVARCKASKCRVCSRSHNTLLHQYSSQPSTEVNPNSSQEQPVTSRGFVNHSASDEETVVLATALVQIKDNVGHYVYARALLDSGSQINFITEELAQRVKAPREEANLNLLGIGQTNSCSKSKVQATIKSRLESKEFSSEFWVLRSISKYQPGRIIPIQDWNIPSNIELADPFFFKPQKVDMLIGAEMFFELLSVGQIKMCPDTPVLQKTVLGWIVSGKFKRSKASEATSCHANIISESETSLDTVLQKFWELEQVPIEASRFTVEQQKCEEFFQQSVRQLPAGRLTVALPFKEDPNLLGLSYDTAKRRYFSLERRLSKTPQVREMYDAFMKEYIDLGHMSIAGNINFDKPHYFIPHQCVLRPESTSTKLRVVFDASCKTSSQKSLNDLLMIGPTIQPELFSTLIRFRLHKYAMTADIEKMYRQVLIDEADRDFQLILYRKGPSDDLNIFRLNTVTYGTSSAPFLAIRCLTHLCDLNKEKFPIGSEIIRNNFYVDDLLAGADSLEELEEIRYQTTEILSSAQFKLTKWFSNCPTFKCSSQLSVMLQFSDNATKALGTYWFPKSDTFEYRLDHTFQELKATKRNILSVTARLYDPLGLVCPVVTKAKSLIQELWLHKLDWDESIPIHLHTTWDQFKQNLIFIDKIKIPRHVLTTSKPNYQVHGFADASIRAYGCCIYIRSIIDGNVCVRLLTGKSKVAPVRSKSLPRLELCAAQLLAKLWSKVKPLMLAGIENVTFWSDSEITLHWIKSHPSTLTTFVSNRVSDIQELSAGITWRHVPTKENPADIVSRGCNVDELRDSLWFTGPPFLLQNANSWPRNEHFELSPDQESLEKRKKSVFTVMKEIPNSIIELTGRISSYPKLIRIVAYVLRFVEGTRHKARYNSLVISPKELNWSFLKVIQTVQETKYSQVIAKLRKSLPVENNLQKLNPFIQELKDENRTFTLVRVGGRLLNAPIPYHAKFPLLMPKESSFITIYLRDLHVKNCHAGAKALVALLRDKIWLVNAKEECSRTVRKCLHCFHYKPKLMSQIMGNLPADRVRALRPFKVCGVDFCGPINVTLKIRGRPPVKMYIAIFVCFTSKAVHIELVSDLTTDAFLLSIQRFIARRGVPSKIYSDNATNFGGANSELRQWRDSVDQAKVESYAAEKGLVFSFIPPRAPHFGGLWEAAVKSAKGLLFRTVGTALLTTEELQTLLAEVEAVLNSRPIAALSSDPNDGEALTPAHLLIGEALGTLPPESAPDASGKLSYLKRWQRISALKRAFWRIWEKDYVRGLQERTKWSNVQPDLAVGKLVLVHDDNRPPLHWVTGRVQAVLPGEDGKVRVVDVKTTNGVYRRPIAKLALLPED